MREVEEESHNNQNDVYDAHEQSPETNMSRTISLGQVVYTSIDTPEQRGYQVVAHSDPAFVPTDDIQTIANASGLDAAISSMMEMPGGLLFYDLPSGRFAVARMYNAGEDFAGRKNRALTHTLVIREEDFQLIGCNPFHLVSHLRPLDDARGDLPPVSLSADTLESVQRDHESLDSLSLSDYFAVKNTFDALDSKKRIVLLAEPEKCERILETMFFGLPEIDRKRLTFATFSLTAKRTAFRFTGISPDIAPSARYDISKDEAVVLETTMSGELPSDSSTYGAFVSSSLKSGDLGSLDGFLEFAQNISGQSSLSDRLTLWQMENEYTEDAPHTDPLLDMIPLVRRAMKVDKPHTLEFVVDNIAKSSSLIDDSAYSRFIELLGHLYQDDVQIPLESLKKLIDLFGESKRWKELRALVNGLPETPTEVRDKIETILDRENQALGNVLSRSEMETEAFNPTIELVTLLETAVAMKQWPLAGRISGNISNGHPLPRDIANKACRLALEAMKGYGHDSSRENIQAIIDSGVLCEADIPEWQNLYLSFRFSELRSGRMAKGIVLPVGRAIMVKELSQYIRKVSGTLGPKAAMDEGRSFFHSKSDTRLPGDMEEWDELVSWFLDCSLVVSDSPLSLGKAADALALALSHHESGPNLMSHHENLFEKIVTSLHALIQRKDRLVHFQDWLSEMKKLPKKFRHAYNRTYCDMPPSGPKLVNEFSKFCLSFEPPKVVDAMAVLWEWRKLAEGTDSKEVRSYRKLYRNVERLLESSRKKESKKGRKSVKRR